MGVVRDCLRSSKGQNLVEFALLTPIVILLMVAIIDFGAAMNRRIVLQHAAREGARMAAVSDNYTGKDGVCDHAFDQAQGAVAHKSDITFAYTDLDSPANGLNAGDDVKITLPAEWDLPILDSALFGLFNTHIPKINLTATGSARLERTVSGATVCPP